MVFYHIYVLNSMSEGQVFKHADCRVASMLKCALEKARASKIQETTTVAALQPALQRRIESRVQGAVANNWAVGAREAKRDPLEYMQLCRKYLAMSILSRRERPQSTGVSKVFPGKRRLPAAGGDGAWRPGRAPGRC